MTIKLIDTPEFKKGSACAEWFKAIKRYDGKDVDAFVAATTKKPPILNKHGKGEDPKGWLRFFV